MSEVPLTQAPLLLGVFCDCHIGQLPVASYSLLAALMRPWILRAGGLGGLDHIGWIWPGGSKSRTQSHQFRTFLNFCTTSFETPFLCTHWRPRDLETPTQWGNQWREPQGQTVWAPARFLWQAELSNCYELTFFHVAQKRRWTSEHPLNLLQVLKCFSFVSDLHA